MKTRVLAILLFLILASCSVVHAGFLFENPYKVKTPPRSKPYDWVLTATVALDISVDQDNLQGEATYAEIVHTITTEMSHVQPRVIAMDSVIRQISDELKVNLFELKSTNPEKYKKILDKNLRKYVDVVIVFYIGNCRIVGKRVVVGTNTYVGPGFFGPSVYKEPVYSDYTVDFPDATLSISLTPAHPDYEKWSHAYEKDTKVDGRGQRRTPLENMRDIIKQSVQEMPIPKKYE